MTIELWCLDCGHEWDWDRDEDEDEKLADIVCPECESADVYPVALLYLTDAVMKTALQLVEQTGAAPFMRALVEADRVVNVGDG